MGKAAAQDFGLSERRILTGLLLLEIFKELGLNKSDNKRLRFMRLKDAVFIHIQSAHGPICPWDNYPTYSMYCTLMHSYCTALRSYGVIRSHYE